MMNMDAWELTGLMVIVVVGVLLIILCTYGAVKLVVFARRYGGVMNRRSMNSARYDRVNTALKEKYNSSPAVRVLFTIGVVGIFVWIVLKAILTMQGLSMAEELDWSAFKELRDGDYITCDVPSCDGVQLVYSPHGRRSHFKRKEYYYFIMDENRKSCIMIRAGKNFDDECLDKISNPMNSLYIEGKAEGIGSRQREIIDEYKARISQNGLNVDFNEYIYIDATVKSVAILELSFFAVLIVAMIINLLFIRKMKNSRFYDIYTVLAVIIVMAFVIAYVNI